MFKGRTVNDEQRTIGGASRIENPPVGGGCQEWPSPSCCRETVRGSMLHQRLCVQESPGRWMLNLRRWPFGSSCDASRWRPSAKKGLVGCVPPRADGSFSLFPARANTLGKAYRAGSPAFAPVLLAGYLHSACVLQLKPILRFAPRQIAREKNCRASQRLRGAATGVSPTRLLLFLLLFREFADDGVSGEHE